MNNKEARLKDYESFRKTSLSKEWKLRTEFHNKKCFVVEEGTTFWLGHYTNVGFKMKMPKDKFWIGQEIVLVENSFANKMKDRWYEYAFEKDG
jgi:hypothetical protein